MQAALPHGFCPDMQPVVVQVRDEEAPPPLDPQASATNGRPKPSKTATTCLVFIFDYSGGVVLMSRAQRNPKYKSLRPAGANAR
jgi:hypothetical protein